MKRTDPVYPITDEKHEVYKDGIDIRTEVASRIMAGLMANQHSTEDVTRVAVRLADALLDELGYAK